MVGRGRRNTAVSSHYSEYKKANNENMFQMLHMNKEGFQPNFSYINVNLKSCIQALNECVEFALNVMFEWY